MLERCQRRLLPSLEPPVLAHANRPATLRRIEQEAIGDPEQLGSQRLLDRDERVRPALAGAALGDETLHGKNHTHLVEPIAHPQQLAGQLEVDVGATSCSDDIGDERGPRGDAASAQAVGRIGHVTAHPARPRKNPAQHFLARSGMVHVG